MAQEHGNPAMVVIDTLAKNLGADENSNQDIGQYVRNVDDLITRPFGCTVATVHHVGHGDKTRASRLLKKSL
jgi:RecA-family ATPase